MGEDPSAGSVQLSPHENCLPNLCTYVVASPCGEESDCRSKRLAEDGERALRLVAFSSAFSRARCPYVVVTDWRRLRVAPMRATPR